MQPAILGGPKAVTGDQEAANRWPIITAEDEHAVLEVMRSGELSCHPVTLNIDAVVHIAEFVYPLKGE
jgi:hypothetical protein